MKPIISEIDYKILYNLLTTQSTNAGKDLGQEVARALIVQEEKMNKKIIRLNSYVEVKDEALGKVIKLTIVLPDAVDLKNRFVSVLSPLAVALIGYKENDLIPWKMPLGETSFKIIKVKN